MIPTILLVGFNLLLYLIASHFGFIGYLLFFSFITWEVYDFFGKKYFEKIRKEEEEKRKEEVKRKEEEWLKDIEPIYRNANGYPEDWQTRRRMVFKNDGGKCGGCGKSRNLHVHHISPLSKGGNHSLSNLELLCEKCHRAKHSSNTELRLELIRHSVYVGKNATIKHARRSWKCALCEQYINEGDSYFGDINNKVCENCFESFEGGLT